MTRENERYTRKRIKASILKHKEDYSTILNFSSEPVLRAKVRKPEKPKRIYKRRIGRVNLDLKWSAET